MPVASAIAQLNVDVLFSGFPGFPKPGEEVFAQDFSIQLGGGPQVMVLALAHLGVPTRLGTFFTDDIQSWLALKMLEDFGYHDYVNLYRREDGHPTVVTSVFSFVEDRSFLAYNEFATNKDLSEAELMAFFADAKVCFAPENPAVLKRLKENGTTLIFDTGWYDDLSLDRYADILRHVDVFCPNDKEALKMTGAATIQDALRQLHAFVPYPVVKTGGKGCVALIQGQLVEVPAIAEFVKVDSTGAGDNFLAGVAYGLYHDWDILDCLRMGNVIGGHSTTQLGCLRATLNQAQAMDYFRKHYG